MEALQTVFQINDIKSEHHHDESSFLQASDEQEQCSNDPVKDLVNADYILLYSQPNTVPDLRQMLLQFQNDCYLCDTVLVGEDGQIRVHGVVLAAASSVFKAFLSSVEADARDHAFVVPGVEVKILHTVVRFAYTGDIAMPNGDVSTAELSRTVKVLRELGFLLPPAVDQLIGDSEVRSDLLVIEHEALSNKDTDVVRCMEDAATFIGVDNIHELTDDDKQEISKEIIKKRKIKKKTNTKKRLTTKIASCETAEVSEKGPFSRICDRCGVEFSDSRHYQQHMHTHRQMKRVKCDKCNTWCSSLSNLRRHQFLHSGDRPYLCQHCGAAFIQRPSLRAHIFVYHPEKAGDLDTIAPNSNCNRKQHSFFKKNALLRRIRKSTRVDDSSDSLYYHCTSCTRRFRSKASLLLHQRTHTDGLSGSKQVVRTGRGVQNCKENGYSCCSCNKIFRYPSELAQHESMAHGEDLQQRCPDCSFRCRYPTMLLKHYMKCHTGETTNRIIQCPVCGKKLANYIQEHMRTHTGERPFKCNVCGNSFRQSSHLVTHMRSHTGERPFACELCDKSYKNKVDLRLHCRKVHDLELSKTPGRRPRMKNYRFD